MIKDLKVYVEYQEKGQMKYKYVPLGEIPINPELTIGDYLKQKDGQIAELEKKVDFISESFKLIVAKIGGVKQ